MEKTVLIKRCIQTCPFFVGKPEMNCDHPFFDGKGYDGMIITHENGTTGYPKKCPLRGEELVVRYKIG